jgi:hypothetical protein
MGAFSPIRCVAGYRLQSAGTGHSPTAEMSVRFNSKRPLSRPNKSLRRAFPAVDANFVVLHLDRLASVHCRVGNGENHNGSA